MRSIIALAVGAALAAALLLIFGATVGATVAAAAIPPSLEQDAPADALAPTAAAAAEVSVSANTGFTRTFQWSITKTAAANPLSLLAGDNGTISYTVAGTRQTIQSGHYITAAVLITNPSPIDPTTLTTITAQLERPNINNIPVDCGVALPYALAPGAALQCSFYQALGSAALPTTTVSVYSDGGVTLDTAVTKPVTSTRVINEIGFNSATINDSYAGPLLPVVAGPGVTLDFTRTYTRPVSCSADPADYLDGLRQIPIENIATISETNQIAVANVEVDCYAPVVSLQAAGGYTRTWDWGVVKSADTVSATVTQSATLPISYTVDVSNTQADSDFVVSGVISVTNQHPTAAMPVNITGTIPGLPPVTLQCGSALNVPAGQTLGCAFTAAAPDAAPRQFTATVTLAGGDYVTSAPVTFTLAAEVDACVDVLDDDGTPGDPGSDTNLGTVCRTEAPKTITYSAAPAFTTCGAQQFVNTVRLAGDSADVSADSWPIDVTVECGPDVVTSVLHLPIIFRQEPD